MPKCSVTSCETDADVEVILYDVYRDGEVFFQQDSTCPYLCTKHLVENEEGAFSEILKSELNVTLKDIANQYEAGERRMDSAINRCVDLRPVTLSPIQHDTFDGTKIPALRDHRGGPSYPYTNQHQAQGFTIYRPLHRS